MSGGVEIAMKQALEVVVSWQKTCLDFGRGSDELGMATKAVTALRQAIEEAEKQEPVAWMEIKLSKDADGLLREKFFFNQDGDGVPVYTTPPKRECAVLTDEELTEVYNRLNGDEWILGRIKNALSFYESIEAKLKEKNI